jgi:hypothetical protein
MDEKQLYKVVFYNQEQVYELYVKRISQDELYGFVLIEDFIFGEKSGIVVDPAEEKLRLEFEGVQRSFIPMHQVIRIDQVKRRGMAKIVPIDKNANGKSGPGYTLPKK